jgi:hypothetical protein
MGQVERLDNYQIKKDADLVAMMDDVRKFLGEMFPSASFVDYITFDMGKSRVYSNENSYKSLLRIIQETRKCDFDYVSVSKEKDDVRYDLPERITFASDENPLSICYPKQSHGILFELGDRSGGGGFIMKLGKSRILLSSDNETKWTKTEKAALLEVLKDYIVKTEEPKDKKGD